MSVRTCAAITLDEAGGGVSAVARLVWRAFESRWRDDARLVTLQPRAARRVMAPPDMSSRVSFGSKLAMTQALGESAWIFYTHLALAQVQHYIPVSLQRPYAVFLHGIEVWRPLTRAQRSALEGARLLVANSSYTAARAAAMHPLLPPVVSGLALAGDDRADEHVRIDESSRSRETVLIVGRMASSERYKGHDQLIDAWPSVLRSCPGARLVVVGDGDDRPRLQAKATVAVDNGSIEFTGFVSAADLERLYRRADVFAMPSRNEGFGLVYLEAMRQATPCVGSTEDAAGEVIEDGVTGVLVPQDDVTRLSAQLINLLRDSALRVRMGQAGRARLRERFSRPQFEARLMSLIDDAFGAAASASVGDRTSGAARGGW